MTSDVQTQDVQTGCGQAGVTQTGIAQTGIAQTEIADAGAAALLGIGVVRVYQWTIRPFIGAHCRFWPSCSDYAVEALRVHGAAWGTALAAKRILRCNPWNEGGVDPVPGIDEDMGH